MLTPWRNAYYPGGLLSLTVAADGTAAGRIVDRTWFRQLRDQRMPRCSVANVVRGDYHGEESTTTIGPYELAGHRGAMLAIGQRVPHCHHTRYFPYDPDDGARELWFLDPWSGSWASDFHVTPDCSDDEFGSSVCASRALAGCGMRSVPPIPGGPSRDDLTNRTGCSPSPSTPTSRT